MEKVKEKKRVEKKREEYWLYKQSREEEGRKSRKYQSQ